MIEILWHTPDKVRRGCLDLEFDQVVFLPLTSVPFRVRTFCRAFMAF